jgi:hypothetical protein
VTVPAVSSDRSGLSRPDETRLRNERIASTARANRFDRRVAVPFICECSEERCDELIRLRLGQFEEARRENHYLVAPGHQIEQGRVVRVNDGLWLFCAESSA